MNTTTIDIVNSEQLKHLFDKICCTGKYQNCLDIGCGKDPKLVRDIQVQDRWGIEAFKPYFDEMQTKKFYNTLLFGDARGILPQFDPSSFDLVLGIDFIEHLVKEDGILFLKEINRLARREILLFTPYKFYHQDAYEDNPYQEHKSGWKPEDFEGYHVYILPKMHGTGALVAHKKL